MMAAAPTAAMLRQDRIIRLRWRQCGSNFAQKR